MGLKRVAIVGAGITKFMRRAQETGRELSFHAASMALKSAGMTLDQVGCVAESTAPDAFDGVHMNGEYLSDGSGGWRKPYLRSYVGGGSGVFVVNHGWYQVASGMFDTCLVVASEKMSSCHPHPQGAFLNIFDQFIERPLGCNLLWIFALEMNRYMHVHGISHEQIALVSVKNKTNALDHPSAQVAEKVTVKDVVNSEVLAWPVHRLDISPTSDGAAALVLVSEDVAHKYTDKPVWIDGVGWSLDTTYWTNKDLYYPRYVEKAATMAYKMAGITDPRTEVHVAEPYDPFDYKELHHMEGLLLCNKGEAPKITEKGITARDGAMPTCPSGGLLGVGNPIAASGVMKVCEMFWQLRGEAGARQVTRECKTALAQAWGDLMQVGTVIVLRK